MEVTRSEVVARMEKLLIEPLARLRLPEAPATLRGLLPAFWGARMAPAAMLVAGRVPLPARVPPLVTVRAEEGAMDPDTWRVAGPPRLVAPV